MQVYPEGLQPTERTHTGAGGKCEEGVAETKRYELTATPIPHPPCAARGRRGKEVEESGVKLRLGKK